MKNPELFHKTVGILVKAYQNETLVHGSPCGCAVGNMIYGFKSMSQIIEHDKIPSADWYSVVIGNISEYGSSQIHGTGYSIQEVMKIEAAFENYEMIDLQDDTDGYLGLMSVIDALMLIHEATEQEAQQAKELFTLTK